jgi:hypothetical protein
VELVDGGRNATDVDQIKPEKGHQGRGVEMSKERAGDLARQCTELVRRGNDFPKVWSILLKSHVLVDGMPRQRLERNRSLLDIPLITGEQLVFDADVKEFRIQ